jgi:hypothetical protein
MRRNELFARILGNDGINRYVRCSLSPRLIGGAFQGQHFLVPNWIVQMSAVGGMLGAPCYQLGPELAAMIAELLK